ncbi:MAG: adenosine deaminase [Gemella sp.]|nr:adenosine deaminase [Gemella sp.]
MSNQLLQLAKTELHCHLDGSLSLAAVRKLAEMARIDIPESDEELRKLVTAPQDVQSLNEYLKTFDFIRPLLQTKESLELAAYDVVKQAAEENVIYIEIRFAPELSMDEGLSAEEVIAAVCDGLRRGEQDFDITAKALICGIRQNDMEINKSVFTATKNLDDKQVVGMDFVGNELDFPAETAAEGIEYAHSLGYPMTFHAGECGCATNIAYAISKGVKRTGHTTAITNHPEIIKEFVKNEVTAELCLVSNFHTKAIRSIEDFPYLQLKEAGARISINTDNRTVSNTNLTKEYSEFVKYFGTSTAEFLKHNQDAIKGSFASDEEKTQLLEKLEQAYKEFL